MNSNENQVKQKKKKEGNFLYDFVKVTGALPTACWLRPKILYAGKKQKLKGGFLIVSNHVSFTDPVMVLFTFWYRRPYCIATKELFEGKLKNFFFNHMHCIMVDRENFNMNTFHVVCEKLSEDKPVVVFPEGTVNREESPLLAFKSGAILMALRAKKPIVPIYLSSPKKKTDRRFVVVGDPIDIAAMCGPIPSMLDVVRINQYVEQKENELMLYFENYQQSKKNKKSKE